jgi:hypothetical protein
MRDFFGSGLRSDTGRSPWTWVPISRTFQGTPCFSALSGHWSYFLAEYPYKLTITGLVNTRNGTGADSCKEMRTLRSVQVAICSIPGTPKYRCEASLSDQS